MHVPEYTDAPCEIDDLDEVTISSKDWLICRYFVNKYEDICFNFENFDYFWNHSWVLFVTDRSEAKNHLLDLDVLLYDLVGIFRELQDQMTDPEISDEDLWRDYEEDDWGSDADTVSVTIIPFKRNKKGDTTKNVEISRESWNVAQNFLKNFSVLGRTLDKLCSSWNDAYSCLCRLRVSRGNLLELDGLLFDFVDSFENIIHDVQADLVDTLSPPFNPDVDYWEKYNKYNNYESSWGKIAEVTIEEISGNKLEGNCLVVNPRDTINTDMSSGIRRYMNTQEYCIYCESCNLQKVSLEETFGSFVKQEISCDDCSGQWYVMYRVKEIELRKKVYPYVFSGCPICHAYWDDVHNELREPIGADFFRLAKCQTCCGEWKEYFELYNVVEYVDGNRKFGVNSNKIKV